VFEGMELHTRTLRAWQLAILRFAVTLDNADRLAVMAIANELDTLGSQHDRESDFCFFRRTSTELCVAILQPNKLAPDALRQFLARLDDDRLRRVFAAATESDPISRAGKPAKRDNGLWKGLSPRGQSARTRPLS
jgi:hypothetical protein